MDEKTVFPVLCREKLLIERAPYSIQAHYQSEQSVSGHADTMVRTTLLCFVRHGSVIFQSDSG
ncbi:MAG: hypothetical protein NC489_25960 [Ruminococcus flavefaciens]|nr:hypothetical protein [Ruminococcus flavefaciens]